MSSGKQFSTDLYFSLFLTPVLTHTHGFWTVTVQGCITSCSGYQIFERTLGSSTLTDEEELFSLSLCFFFIFLSSGHWNSPST